MNYIEENVRLIRDNYHDLIMNYPLDTEQVWDKEFIIRDKLEEKGYNLINFVNFPLFIDNIHFGHFNAINGYKSSLNRLFPQLRSFGFVCLLRDYDDVMSKGAIVFPENITCELFDYIDNIKSIK